MSRNRPKGYVTTPPDTGPTTCDPSHPTSACDSCGRRGEPRINQRGWRELLIDGGVVTRGGQCPLYAPIDRANQ